MFALQVYLKDSKRYVTRRTGGKGAMLLAMTLPHVHEGLRRRVIELGTKRVLVRR